MPGGFCFPPGILSPVKAIAKARPAPGVELIEVPEPAIRPGHVKLRVSRGSVCGTDVHIYNWDPWAAGRIHPPRVIGHEFCGEIVEVAPDVTERAVGDFVASESHIVCGHCKQCLHGQGHVCVNTTILGVDVDGGFGKFAVIPWQNARPIPKTIPHDAASMLDALGNAVHTVMAGPVEGRSILITGMGPIGLFAVAICRVLGAAKIYATEVSPYRIEIAKRLGADVVIQPLEEDAAAFLRRAEPGGVDATLEMSGHPSALQLAIEETRPGGRISLLGVYPDAASNLDMNSVIFKGIDVQGIVGRRLWETWDQMTKLLTERGLDISPVITHQVPYTQVTDAFELLKAGKAGKIVLDFSDAD